MVNGLGMCCDCAETQARVVTVEAEAKPEARQCRALQEFIALLHATGLFDEYGNYIGGYR